MAGFVFRTGLGRALTFAEYDDNLRKSLNVSELGAPGADRLLYLLAAGGVAAAGALGANLNLSGGTLAVSPQGAASGLDADKLDGLQATEFSRLADIDGQGNRTVRAALAIRNNSGTLECRWGSPAGAGYTPTLIAPVSGWTTAWSAIKTSADPDATTAMTNGGKVSSVSSNAFILDTTNAQDLDSSGLIVGVLPTVGSPATLRCYCTLVSSNINGVTKYRPYFVFRYHTGTAWTAFALNTTNITAGNSVDLVFQGGLQ